MAVRKEVSKTGAENVCNVVAENRHAPAAAVPIVGIGASAGGLEAFEQFFRNLAPDSGIGFVLVPHLDPGHASMLGEILQRSTSMPVVEVEDQMAVAPNRVHVVPPNRDMAIFHGILQLSVPDVPRGHRMPIDAFLRSLADDQGDRAIGVVLSGTGTDGTLGLRAILGAGGVSFVQEPASARYRGMPESAIQAGYATCVLAAEKMPGALLDRVRQLSGGHAASPVVPASVPGLNRILMLLRSSTGHDFSQYKRTTIGRRVERRMSQHAIDDTEVYIRYLKEHPNEVRALFRELLINVTSFFRDPEAFATLRQDILPQLFAGKVASHVFRVWVAGCASGEEAYSIAIVFREFMDEIQQEFKVQIYATDIDDDAIGVARGGVYPPNIAQDLSAERLRRFFSKDDLGFRVKKEIREMVVFAIQNVIKDPPFTRLDLLSCRNLLIYLEPELQNRLFPVFHYALRAGGVLFLSPSESIGRYSELFTPLNRKWKFYRVIRTAASTSLTTNRDLTWAAVAGVQVPDEGGAKAASQVSFAELARSVLLHAYAPPSVVTDLQGNIVFVHGETGRYLSPAPGHATLNVIDMAHAGLQMELRMAIQHFASRDQPALSREALVRTNGGFHGVTVSIRALFSPGTGEGWLLLSFQETSAPARRRRSKQGAGDLRRVQELERDLIYTKENLQATIEELPGLGREHPDVLQDAHRRNAVNDQLPRLPTRREGDELVALAGRHIGLGGRQQILLRKIATLHDILQRLRCQRTAGDGKTEPCREQQWYDLLGTELHVDSPCDQFG